MYLLTRRDRESRINVSAHPVQIIILSHVVTMALTRKYPRAAVRKIIKGHTDKHAAQEVDALVRASKQNQNTHTQTDNTQLYLDYILFLQQYDAQ